MSTGLPKSNSAASTMSRSSAGFHGLRLAHDRQIEPPRNVGENVGGARDRYVEHARLGRNGGAPRGFIELGCGGPCRLLVFSSLRLHRLGGKTIAHGCERLVKECDPGKVRIEGGGHRNGKIRRDVTRGANR